MRHVRRHVYGGTNPRKIFEGKGRAIEPDGNLIPEGTSGTAEVAELNSGRSSVRAILKEKRLCPGNRVFPMKTPKQRPNRILFGHRKMITAVRDTAIRRSTFNRSILRLIGSVLYSVIRTRSRNEAFRVKYSERTADQYDRTKDGL